MIVKIVCVYLGVLPKYFQLWLNSCKCNSSFQWLVFNDTEVKYDIPQNVRIIYTNINDIENRIRKYVGEFQLFNSRKLCDYKPLYGILFQDYLKNADFWGHCDLDVIWGKLDHYITDEMLNTYDKIFRWGHLVLYRNDINVNKRYLSNEQINPVKKILRMTDYCGMDEAEKFGMHRLYSEYRWPYYNKDLSLDIEIYKYSFFCSKVKFRSKKVPFVVKKNSDGVFACWYEDGVFRELEFPYVHFQKRKMECENMNEEQFLIVPNKFIKYGDVSKQRYHEYIKVGLNGGIKNWIMRKRYNLYRRTFLYNNFYRKSK